MRFQSSRNHRWTAYSCSSLSGSANLDPDRDRFGGNTFVCEFVPQLLGGFREIAFLSWIVFETQAREFDRVCGEHLGCNRREVTAHDDLFGLANALFEQGRRNGALVDVEERDVVVGDLVKQDDELDEIGVACCQNGSLPRPNRLFNKEAMLNARAYASRSLCRGL